MRIRVVSTRLTIIKSDLLLAGFFENCQPIGGAAGEVDWLFGGVLSKLIIQQKISGKLSETLLLITKKRLYIEKVIFLGLGKRHCFTYSTINKLSKKVFEICRQLQVKNFVIDFLGIEGNSLDNSQCAEAFLSGFPKRDKKEEREEDEEDFFTVTLLISDQDKAREINRNIKILSRF